MIGRMSTAVEYASEESSPWGALKLIAGNANRELAQRISEEIGVPLTDPRLTRYSDGEIDVKIEGSMRGHDVFVIQPTCHPVNENLMELFIILDALRRASAGRVTAVIPFASSYRTLWLGLGTVAFDLLLAILITSLLRGFFGHRTWRAVHWLAYASWPVAVVHGFGTGTDSWSTWLLVLNAVCILAVGWALAVRLQLPAGDPLAAERARFRESARSRGTGR